MTSRRLWACVRSRSRMLGLCLRLFAFAQRMLFPVADRSSKATYNCTGRDQRLVRPRQCKCEKLEPATSYLSLMPLRRFRRVQSGMTACGGETDSLGLKIIRKMVSQPDAQEPRGAAVPCLTSTLLSLGLAYNIDAGVAGLQSSMYKSAGLSRPPSRASDAGSTTGAYVRFPPTSTVTELTWPTLQCRMTKTGVKTSSPSPWTRPCSRKAA